MNHYKKKNHNRQAAFIGGKFSSKLQTTKDNRMKKGFLLNLKLLISDLQNIEAKNWPTWAEVNNRQVFHSRQYVHQKSAPHVDVDWKSPDLIDALIAEDIETNTIPSIDIIERKIAGQTGSNNQLPPLGEEEVMGIVNHIALHISRSSIELRETQRKIPEIHTHIQAGSELTFFADANNKKHVDAAQMAYEAILNWKTSPNPINQETLDGYLLAWITFGKFKKIQNQLLNFDKYIVCLRRQIPHSLASMPVMYITDRYEALHSKHLRKMFYRHAIYRIFSKQNPSKEKLFPSFRDRLRALYSCVFTDSIFNSFIAGPLGRDLFIVYFEKRHAPIASLFCHWLNILQGYESASLLCDPNGIIFADSLASLEAVYKTITSYRFREFSQFQTYKQ